VLAPEAVYRRRSLHDELEGLVQPERRRALHVNLVIHGQRTCLPRTPRCSACPAHSACRRLGLGRRGVALEEIVCLAPF
jgi:endonuclease-3